MKVNIAQYVLDLIFTTLADWDLGVIQKWMTAGTDVRLDMHKQERSDEDKHPRSVSQVKNKCPYWLS